MTTVYQSDDYRALLAAVRAAPDDDLPRLVLADWLEERKEAERAELIRVQCADRRGPFTFSPGHAAFCGVYMYGIGSRGVLLAGSHAGVSYTVDRGFVTAVRGPLAALVGGVCERCGGTPATQATGRQSCSHCLIYGYPHGILPGLVRREPVERVEVTDREPYENAARKLLWLRGQFYGITRGERAVVPPDLWKLLKGYNEFEFRRIGVKWWNSTDAAKAALSAALLAWAESEGHK